MCGNVDAGMHTFGFSIFCNEINWKKYEKRNKKSGKIRFNLKKNRDVFIILVFPFFYTLSK